MSNIPGGVILPGTYSNVSTLSKGTSVANPGRLAVIMGLGSMPETIVSSALGGGLDGLNSSFTSTSGAVGRYFQLTQSPIVSNRTQLFKNGIPLVGLEDTIDDSSFSDLYDYRIDIETGDIELQTSHLIDQGGSFFVNGVTNVGDGYLTGLSLVDENAPQEIWTIKCISVQRNNLNQPIAGTANFIAFGSVSGNVLDAYGSTVIWLANNQTVSNSILQFAIYETSPVFREGDYFTIKVYSGVLNRNDSLAATYIPVANINNPVTYTSLTSIAQAYGNVSLDNTLTLGSYLAFSNSVPSLMAVQCAPPLPRRVSYELETAFPATSTNVDDFLIPLPTNVSPDPNSQIHIFVTNPATKVEKQLLPNKFPFFTLGDVGQPTVHSFVFDNANLPAGNSFSYSVIQQNATLDFGQDGYINRDLTTQINATFSSASFIFNSSNVGDTLNVIDATNNANIGSFAIVAVDNGVLSIRAESTPPFSDFINETSVGFHLVDPIFGETVAGSSGSDGALVAVGDTATGTFHSSAITFSSFGSILADGYKLQVTSSVNATNIGLYDITAYNSGSNTLTIAKSFVSEHNTKFEVIDTSQTSDYLVLNHNVVPNGYSLRATIIDVKDSTFYDAGWVNALASLETQELDIVVPLPNQTISAIFENTVNHCLAMSNIKNRKERVAFIGAIDGLTPANLTGAKLAAVEDIGVLEGIQGASVADVLSGNTEDLANYSVPNAYGETFRAVYFAPDQIVAQVGTQNQIIDGFYQAAAAAGKICSISNLAVPLTNQVLSGYTILQNRMYNNSVLESLALAGVTICQPVSGGATVIWGISTSQSGFPEEQEISIVFIRDRIAKAMRAGMSGFVGNPQDNDIISTINARATALLNGFVSQRIITAFTGLTVAQDSTDPRQINVSINISVVYPLNWIYIQIGVG